MRPSLIRLDAWLVQRGLAHNKAEAHHLISSGVVWVDGIAATSVHAQVNPRRDIRMAPSKPRWVSRGAHKLLGALRAFGLSPSGKVCADLGASTGGFTQVLLRQGATRVYAIDVGRGQLAWELQRDDRVVVMDTTNARHLTHLPDPIDWVVGDLSFISLGTLLPVVHRLLRPNGTAVLLVKPQFEAPKQAVDDKGRVRSAQARTLAIQAVADRATQLGFAVEGSEDCVLPGAKAKNIEHFLHLSIIR